MYVKMMTVVTSLADVTCHLPTRLLKPVQIFILSEDFIKYNGNHGFY